MTPRSSAPWAASRLVQPIVGIAADPRTGGYWEVASDGGLFAFNAPFFGSMGGKPLNAPIVGMVATPDGLGYWEVAADGGIFNFGDAKLYGSMGGKPLNKPVVGIATTPDGGGYWEVATDGGIFNFGDAAFLGSMGGKPLNKPVVGIAGDQATGGYWEVASDGGLFAYNAPFFGSPASMPLNKPVVGMASTPDGQGYWETATTGASSTTGTPSSGAPPDPSRSTSPWLGSPAATRRQTTASITTVPPARDPGGTVAYLSYVLPSSSGGASRADEFKPVIVRRLQLGGARRRELTASTASAMAHDTPKRISFGRPSGDSF